MKKEVTATFTLTPDEVKEALYDMFVRKLKAHDIDAVFSQYEIYCDVSSAELIISETKELE
jgi:hypothetical protein